MEWESCFDSQTFPLPRNHKRPSSGKTWLLNKLFGANLPAGKLCTTRGLSFLWFKERRMLVIDSAGVQSTVSYRAQAVDAIHDAQTTESLMFEMVSRNWPCFQSKNESCSWFDAV